MIPSNQDYSFGSGTENAKGLQLKHTYENQSAVIEFEVTREYTGHQGLLHGGITAALIDEVMYYAVMQVTHEAVTIHLEIDYKKPGILGHIVIVKAWITKQEDRKIWLTALLTDKDSGQILATGEGIYCQADIKKLAGLS